MEICKYPVSRLYDRVEGLEKFVVDAGLDWILQRGAIVAGGLPRFLLRARSVSPEYFSKGGDIDFFFRDEDSLRSCIAQVRTTQDFLKCDPTYDVLSTSFRRDINLAIASKIWNKRPWWSFSGNGKKGTTMGVKYQFVECKFGTPHDVITSFDFLNSMVGFDNDHYYEAEGFQEAERDEMIALNPEIDHHAFLGKRLSKYTKKYGYKGVSPSSRKKLEDVVFDLICSDKINSNVLNGIPDPRPGKGAVFSGYRNVVKALIPHLPDDLLIMFMGHVEERQARRSTYSEMVNNDLARSEMRKRITMRKEG